MATDPDGRWGDGSRDGLPHHAFLLEFAWFGVDGLKVNSELTPAWCERLYRAKAAGLILHGRVLGLSYREAEDVLQETFVALLRLVE